MSNVSRAEQEWIEDFIAEQPAQPASVPRFLRDDNKYTVDGITVETLTLAQPPSGLDAWLRYNRKS